MSGARSRGQTVRGVSRRAFLSGLGLGAAATLLASCSPRRQAASGAPNIVLLTADDMHWRSVGCFGGLAPEITPHLDALAAGGMRFERAHVNIAACQPSRAVLLTGLHPHRNGVTGFGMPIQAGVPTLSALLSDAGYETALLGKEHHYQPLDAFRWGSVVSARQLQAGRDPASFASWTRLVIRTARSAKRPFFIHANSHDPHRPFHGSADEKRSPLGKASYPAPSRVYAAEEVQVPGFLPDLPSVREEFAQYCSSVRRLDDTVGAILEVLAAEEAWEDSVVVFLSDHGMSFPFAKANCYLASTRTPLIVRWNGKIAAGAVDDAHFVEGVDLMPTLLEIAAPDASVPTDGRSFLPLLQGRAQTGRDGVVTAFNETRHERRYEMRALQHGRWGYIWNPWADGTTRFIAASQAGLSMAAMIEAAQGDEEIEARVRHFLYRSPEELYDVERDPDALRDLSGDPAYAEPLAAMRRRLGDWLRRHGDPLAERFAAVG